MRRITSLIALVVCIFSTSAEARHYRHHRSHGFYDAGSVIGGRPSGCPYAFCGCSASLYLFGKIIPELNLASNWFHKFPRVPLAMAGPRMAAARPGHVMVLVEHVSGNRWIVHDGNSGGHMTRLHERDISGYIIVNPNA